MAHITYVVLSMITTITSNDAEALEPGPPHLIRSVHHTLQEANRVVDKQVADMIEGGEEGNAIVHAEQRVGRSYGCSYGEVVTKQRRWRIWVEEALVEAEGKSVSASRLFRSFATIGE